MNRILQVAIAAAVVGACTGFAGDTDAVWMQQKSVAVGSASFQQCVAGAVVKVKGVSVNRSVAGSADVLPLEVKLARAIPFLDVEVQRRGSSAAVVFTGRGNAESDADRAQISPLLQSIAGAIGSACAK